MLSREFAFLVNNWLFLVAAIFVLGATMWPTFTEWRMVLAERYPDLLGWQDPGERVTIGAPFFNRYMRPLGLSLLLLTGIGPLLAWRKTSQVNLVKQFLGRWSPASSPPSSLLALGLGSPWAWPASACAPSPSGPSSRSSTAAWPCADASARRSVLDALIGLVLRRAPALRRLRRPPRHRADVPRLGRQRLQDRAQDHAAPRRHHRARDYVIRHDGLRATEDWQKEMITRLRPKQLAVLKDGDQKTTLLPARWWYFQLPEQPTTEVSRYMTFGEDVYVSIQEVDMTTAGRR